ncbi:MAG: MATE family efflux transporter [candidate division Zixibacteria bacterium]|nr:MATE family efflux transporter [candidate division Zixibacteria bacterium]
MTQPGKTDALSDNPIISGPIARTVWSLAIPVVMGQLMQFSLSVINLFWVGRLGPAAQDAITTAMVVIWTVYASQSIIVIGVAAIVSRAVGAGDVESARHTSRQAILYAVMLSATYAVAGLLLTPWLLNFMSTSPETTRHAIPYIRIFFAANLFSSLSETVYAVFRASGNTRTPTFVGIVVVVANMVLDPILIFGWGFIPRLEVAGASLATAISLGIGTVLIWRAMNKGKAGFSIPKPLTPKIDWPEIRRISRIGLPITVQQLAFVAVYWFLVSIVHRFGDAAGAAMGIGNRMESLSYLTCLGFSVAASTMVGQNLGAQQPDRAARGAWIATGLAVAATLATSILLISIPNLIAAIFTPDPQVRHMAHDYLIILGLSQTVMAIEIVLEGSFSGAGDTMPPMIVLLPGAVIRIPLAYFLAFPAGLGLNGVWWTLTITTFVKAAVLAFWFSRGKWKTRPV